MNGYCVNAGKVSYDECDLCNPPCSVCGDRGCHEMYTMGGELICSSCDEWWNCGSSCSDCDEVAVDGLVCESPDCDNDGECYVGDSVVCRDCVSE